MDDQTEQQIERLQKIDAMMPRKSAIFFLVVPILSVVSVAIAYVVMFSMGIQGRVADGERLTFVWKACPEAKPVLERRVLFMALGEPEWSVADGTVSLTVTLPAEPEVAARIPITLAMPGVLLGVRESDRTAVVITNKDVVAVANRLDLVLMPWTVLTLTEAAQKRLLKTVIAERAGKVVYTLDGAVIATVSNLKGAGLEVEFSPIGEDDRDRLRKAAERTVVLESGPLPCPVVRVSP